ncbi:MAG: alpha/beta hydrolase [Christensenellaceae bacterium]|nr:alpha/beta hydrolase [Christensenellaceae bacterium]
MPSPVSVLLREEIRLLKPFIGRMSISRARALQDTLGGMGAKSVAGRVTFEPADIGECEACFALPCNEPDSRRAILYLHGGAYVAGNLAYARCFAGILSDHTRRRVLAVAYRLAPEHPFPAALDDAVGAYRHLLDSGYEPRQISFVGESAGGGLIYCLGQKLKELRLPLPAAMVGISPWADLTFSGASYKTNAKKDPSLNEAALRRYAKAYADGQLNNPLVSPAFGDYEGFPPSLIFAGGSELLLSDAEMMAARLTQCGCRCELHVEEGLWHVYVLFGIPEARVALDKIADFLELWA